MKSVTGGYVAKPTITERRKKMRFGVSTNSLTASGIVPIRGVNKYPTEPDIYFTREAWVKQCYLVEKCTKEVGWFGLVDYDEKDNSFTITELVIPTQEVTAAETDIGKEELADAAMELIEAGKDTSKMYAWFHSHVNMGVSPSAQDEFQVEDFLEDLADQPEVPAFIRGIQNKKGDLKLDVYYVQHGIAFQNVDFHIEHNDDPQWFEDIEKEIKDKVKERSFYQQPYVGGTGGSRPQAVKSQASANGSVNGRNGTASDNYAYDHGVGLRNLNGFGWGDWDYDDEGNIIFDTDEVAEAIITPASSDILTLPKPVDFTLEEELAMEIMFRTDDEEVLLDNQGKLWISNAAGDIFNYQEYTDVFGEISTAKKQ